MLTPRTFLSFPARPAASACLAKVAALGLSLLLGCDGGTSPESVSRDAAAPRDAGSPPKVAVVTDSGRPGSRDAGSDASSDAGSIDAAEPDVELEPSDYVRPSLCDRPAEDAIRDLFCGRTAPKIANLDDFQSLIGVSPLIRAARPGATGSYDPSKPIDPTTLIDIAVFTSHSTALSGHLVSSLNPRAIVLGNATIMTFQRGVQQVELAAQSKDGNRFNFYLLSFEQACNAREGGCRPGDLFTSRIENDWLSVSLRDDEELKNTPLDCRQCHQRGLETPMLLMRELQAPWTHFFETDPPAGIDYALPGVRGSDLVADYALAKGDEAYSGVAQAIMRHTVGAVLQNLVPRNQPLEFDSPTIEEERWPFNDGVYPKTPAPSPTWDEGYAAFKRGDQMALPYFEPRPTDPAKQARLTEAYQRYRAGELSADDLPDMSDIFPDDPMLRAKIGLQTEPNATAPEALIQACGSCHNDVLDQSISRARFNVALGRMDRAELNLAIERISLPATDPRVMPPVEGRQLDDGARTRLLAYLKTGKPTPEEQAALEHAAVKGMTGGSLP